MRTILKLHSGFIDDVNDPKTRGVIVDVSEEFEPEPESVKRKTSSKRRVKKKSHCLLMTTLSLMIQTLLWKPTRRRKSGKVTSDPPKKLKGVPSLTPKEQEVVDIIIIPGVPDESTVVSATSSEGTSTKPGVPNEEKEITKENVILKWGSKQESEYTEKDKLDDEEKDDKEGDADNEYDETESDKDDVYKYKIRIRKDEDEEMINAEVDDSDKVSTVKDTIDAEINSLLEVKIQSEVPHTQSPSMLSVPVSVISKPTVLTPIQESPSKAIVTALPPPSISTTPYVPQQTTTPIPTQIITTDAPTVTTDVLESKALLAVQLRVAKLEKDMSDLKKLDLSTEALSALKI
ncbi:hypothetical protein Tco_1110941 [Tanacetum coccineum]|uniref:Uncharacterized protein n=1 Tax=Tanacetum coccineum TaxID=301880 RepID=A0ABQ5IMB4_9ASTR